ncbi:MAG: glycosyltransferase [Alphaproteobacteria bacterium]|nr:glycosyltransferase [Alphaproteobacteria bacterium]
MTRFARVMPVYYVEEPAFEGESPAHLVESRLAENLTVLVPHLPANTAYQIAVAQQRKLLTRFLTHRKIDAPVVWFYTAAAMEFARSLTAATIVYDCMDELSAFQGASPAMRQLETRLFQRADVVFTGGQSLYEAKCERHHNVHAFPSAVDVAHFARARTDTEDPGDQCAISHPRLGFFGVIDERFDRDLVARVAQLRPDWQLIMLGPVVKIDPDILPKAPNIHYLGRKSYDELPAYIAGWDLAIMPFAINEATRFISPTKTPEYLAAGKPIVSTPIVDVVRGWGNLEAVRIADTPANFVSEAEIALSLPKRDPDWLKPVDARLAQVSWDRTWARMAELTTAALAHHQTEQNAPNIAS